MSRKKKDPLRELTEPERRELESLSRSQSAPAAEVIRAKLLLAVVRGDDYQDAARSVGRRSGDAVSHLVARFNAEGLEALTPRHGGGRRPTYGPEATGADRRRGGLGADARGRRHGHPVALDVAAGDSRSPDGLPKVSTYTIRRVLRESGASYQRTRAWCPTGTALRRRKAGAAVVTDPDSDAKKLIEAAYLAGEAMGLAVWCTDQAGPYQTIPYAGHSWRTQGDPRAAAARVPARRHGQRADAVPSGRRPRPRQRREDLPQRGPASLAQARVDRDPRRDARPSVDAGRRPARGLGAAGRRASPSCRRSRSRRRRCGCSWCWTTWPGTRRPIWCAGCSSTASCPLHAGRRVVGEDGRVPAADPHAAGPGRPVPERLVPDHRLVRGGREALGRAPTPFVWGGKRTERRRRQARARHLAWAARGRALAARSRGDARLMATSQPGDPLVSWSLEIRLIILRIAPGPGRVSSKETTPCPVR